MISIIRRSFKSRIYKVVLWITILALAGIFSLPELLKIGNRAAWLARVNKQEVSVTDYMQKASAYQEYISALRAQYGQAADLFLQSMQMDVDPKTYALNQVIQEALLDQQANKLGITVGSHYIEEKLANPLFVREELADLVPLAAFDQQGMVNMPLLRSYFQRLGISSADFDKKVENKLKRKTLLQAVGLSGHVSNFELQEQLTNVFAPKRYSFLKLPLQMFIDQEKKSVIPASELQTYFETQNAANKKYWVPQKRNGIVWKLTPADYGIVITDADVANYYEDNKVQRYIKEPAKVQVRHIFFKVPTELDRQKIYERAQTAHQQLLQDPTKFEQLAKELSDDADTKNKGGLIPYFSRGQKEQAFDKAAFILKENGAVSDVIYTKDGFEIIQRVDKKMAEYKPLESVKKEITQALLHEKFTQDFVRDIKRIAAQDSPAKLAEFMAEKKAHKQVVTGITRDDAQWGTVLFGLRQKNDVDAYTEKDQGFVVELSDIAQSYLPELSAVKDQVSHDIHVANAQKKLAEAIKKARSQAVTSSLQEVAKSLGGQVQTTPWVTRIDKDAILKLREQGLPVEQMFQLEKAGSTLAFEPEKDGFIIKLDEVKPADSKEVAAKKDDLAKELANENAGLMRAGFVALLYRSAKIETNESVANLNFQE